MKYLGWVFVAFLLLDNVLAVADESPTPAKKAWSWETRPDVWGVIANCPELKYPMPKGWQPTLRWWEPADVFSDPAKAKVAFKELWKRGITPQVGLYADDGVEAKKIDETIARAKMVAEAGLPVNIQIFGAIDLYKSADGKVLRHPDMPDMKNVSGVWDLPCITIKDGWKRRAAHLRELYKKINDAKIPVAAVWFDYEGPPYPWNGQLERAKACPTCRKQIPELALKSQETFVPYVNNMNIEALDEAFGKPTHEAFPKACIGQYGFTPSSVEYPVFAGYMLPFCPAQRTTVFSVSAPALYAQPSLLRGYYNVDWPISQAEADMVYFVTLIREVTNIHHNLRPDQRIVPFVARYVDVNKPETDVVMSDWIYRECLRHAMLRGVKGFYCFCCACPPFLDYFRELNHLPAVYNEFFAYSEFFEQGKVLNDALPSPKTPGVVWSGLGLPDKALIRVIALGRSLPEMVEITPFPGVPVRLLAPPAGQTYIVERSGHVRPLD